MSIVAAASTDGAKGKKAKALSPAAHTTRRKQLAAEGAKLENTTPRAVKASGAVPQPVRDSLAALAAKQGFEAGRIIRYEIERPAGAKGGAPSTSAKGKGKAKGKAAAKAKSGGAASVLAANGVAAGEAIHVMFSRQPSEGTAAANVAAAAMEGLAAGGAAAPGAAGGGAAATGAGGAAALVGTSGAPSRPKIVSIRALIAQTRDGKVVSFRRVASK